MKKILLILMIAMLAAGFACAPVNEATEATGDAPATVIHAEAPAEAPAPATAAQQVDGTDYEALQTLLMQIATDYQPGTAGCSLQAAKLAGQLLDWNAANAPESARVTETMDIASKLVSSATPQEYGEQFNGVHNAAIELTKEYGADYLASAGYTPTAYPYDSADVEALFTALRAGLGDSATPFLEAADPTQPFAMDIDGDGVAETVTVAVDEDKYTTDITIAGNGKTYTDHLDIALMFAKAYVGGAWLGSDGQTLFLFGDEASDDYTTHIYRLSGGTLQHADIYGSVLGAEPDGYVTINTVVNVFGTYGGICQYKMNDDFTFSLCSSYAIDGADGVANGRTLTVICDSLPAVKMAGTDEPVALPKGTQLLLSDTDQESYAVLADQNGDYYRVSIAKHDDDWQWYIGDMPEEQCFDPLLYAG